VPAFGHRRLGEIRREAVKNWIAGLTERGLARNTVRLAVATLRVIMNGAIEDGLLESNPVQGLGKFVKSQKTEREAAALKPSEVESLLISTKESSPAHYTLLLAALRAGLCKESLQLCSGVTFSLVRSRTIRTDTYWCSVPTTGAGPARCSHPKARSRDGLT